MTLIGDQISTQLAELGLDIPIEEIETRIRLLSETFHVPEIEAKRSVLNYFLKEHGITIKVTGTKISEDLKIAEIHEAGKWVNIKAKVVKLWDSNTDSISQIGLIGDETGVMKFVKWKKADLPDLSEGNSYLFKNLITDEYNGRISVKLNRTSNVLDLDEDIVSTFQNFQSDELKIAEINEPGRWINLTAKVTQLLEPNSETIAQTGYIADETSIIKFIKWANTGLPDLSEGKNYIFKNIVTDNFKGYPSIKINRSSEIIELSNEIKVGILSFSGAVVDVSRRSGLIKRCPNCNIELERDNCEIHGKVNVIHDLCIRAVMDNGIRIQEILLDRKKTEDLIGFNLAEARKKITEMLDQEILREIIEAQMVGKYFTVTGSRLDRYNTLEVETISKMPPITSAEINELVYSMEA